MPSLCALNWYAKRPDGQNRGHCENMSKIRAFARDNGSLFFPVLASVQARLSLSMPVKACTKE
jgi:hypothetical protein